MTSKAGAAEGNGKSYTREEAYTDPEMAKEFIERTNVDALAIGFGTAHGIYTEKPVLDLNRIALIKSAKDIPYVMHGGSGLSEKSTEQQFITEFVRLITILTCHWLVEEV